MGDPYLDTLAEVRDAGFMAEYVLAFLARQGWTISGEELARLNVAGFTAWMAQHLPKSHEPETRVTFHLKAPVRPAPTPGAHIIGAEQIDVQRMSCAQIAPAIDRAVTDWDREAKTLTAVPLSVTSRALILPSLAVLARDDRALRDGVVLASGLVAEVMFDAGFCAVDREAWADAERLLRQTIGVAPMSAKARGELVQTLIMEKKLDDADAELDRAIAISDSVCQTAILWRKRGFILSSTAARWSSPTGPTRGRWSSNPGSQLARSEMQLIVKLLQQAGTYDEKLLGQAMGPPGETVGLGKMSVTKCPQ